MCINHIYLMYNSMHKFHINIYRYIYTCELTFVINMCIVPIRVHDLQVCNLSLHIYILLSR